MTGYMRIVSSVDNATAQIFVAKSVEDPIYDAKENIIGVLNLLECCRANKIKKFIFIDIIDFIIKIKNILINFKSFFYITGN